MGLKGDYFKEIDPQLKEQTVTVGKLFFD